VDPFESYVLSKSNVSWRSNSKAKSFHNFLLPPQKFFLAKNFEGNRRKFALLNFHRQDETPNSQTLEVFAGVKSLAEAVEVDVGAG
jgi:hypothetical protein